MTAIAFESYIVDGALFGRGMVSVGVSETLFASSAGPWFVLPLSMRRNNERKLSPHTFDLQLANFVRCRVKIKLRPPSFSIIRTQAVRVQRLVTVKDGSGSLSSDFVSSHRKQCAAAANCL